jgi:hypothetical protein
MAITIMVVVSVACWILAIAVANKGKGGAH